MPPIVFFDQNRWLYLAQEQNGTLESHHPDLSDILDFVTTTAKNEEVIYPIDLVRMRETARHHRPENRDEFFDFLFTVSNGYTVAPYSIVRKEEIVWRLDRLQGNSGYMNGRVVNKGAAHLFGGQNYQIKTEDPETNIHDSISDEELQEMYKLIESRVVFNYLKNPSNDVFDMLRNQTDWESMANQLNQTQESHKTKYNDNENRRRKEKIRHFMEDTIPEYFSSGLYEGLSLDELSADLSDYWSGAPDIDEAEAFLQSFPAEYTLTELIHQRDIQGSEWESNDIADILTLSVAIPYCDVVVADNQFVDLANRAELGEIYHTEILNNLREVPDIVRKQLKD